jgi:hypothetical protein
MIMPGVTADRAIAAPGLRRAQRPAITTSAIGSALSAKLLDSWSRPDTIDRTSDQHEHDVFATLRPTPMLIRPQLVCAPAPELAGAPLSAGVRQGVPTPLARGSCGGRERSCKSSLSRSFGVTLALARRCVFAVHLHLSFAFVPGALPGRHVTAHE